MRLAAIVAAVLTALTACSPSPSGNVSSGPGGPDAVSVVAIDNAFDPEHLEVPAGDEIEVEITNEGGTTHDFTVEALDLSTGSIEPGEVATATFRIRNGETTFKCTIHGGMDGIIVGS